MNIIEIIALASAMMALAALPSASVALVVTRSATLGLANGLAVTLGIIFGDVVFILLAVYGLSVLAETLGSFFVVIKYIGATYLLWLGYSLLKSPPAAHSPLDGAAKKQNIITSLIAGFILTLGDVKAIIFYASLLPAFIDVSALTSFDVITFIATMVVGLGSVKVIYALSATKIFGFAKTKGIDESAKKVTGSLMICAGGYLIIKA